MLLTWYVKLRCKLKKHKFQFFHAYVIRSTIFKVYKCKYCGKEIIKETK